MAGSVRFEDFSIQVQEAINDAANQFLMEAAGEVQSQAARNTRVDTGQLKGSWDYKVDGDTATIGSPLENAIWEEFGTGEHALQGNGRQGGWAYKDAKGDWHYTKGKMPSRAFHKAYTTSKPKIIKRAEQIFKAKLE